MQPSWRGPAGQAEDWEPGPERWRRRAAIHLIRTRSKTASSPGGPQNHSCRSLSHAVAAFAGNPAAGTRSSASSNDGGRVLRDPHSVLGRRVYASFVQPVASDCGLLRPSGACARVQDTLPVSRSVTASDDTGWFRGAGARDEFGAAFGSPLDLGRGAPNVTSHLQQGQAVLILALMELPDRSGLLPSRIAIHPRHPRPGAGPSACAAQ